MFLDAGFSKSVGSDEQNSVVTYAGNIGKGQGLEKIVPKMAALLGEKYTLQIVGDGGMRHVLEEEVARSSLNNVVIKNPVDRKELLDIYNASDWLFLHLNDCKAFDKVLPSKIFEYAATGKPVIAGVAGYSADFLRNHVPGCIVFTPCDADDFYAKFKKFGACDYDRFDFIDNFKRETIMSQMVTDVLDVGRRNAA